MSSLDKLKDVATNGARVVAEHVLSHGDALRAAVAGRAATLAMSITADVWSIPSGDCAGKLDEVLDRLESATREIESLRDDGLLDEERKLVNLLWDLHAELAAWDAAERLRAFGQEDSRIDRNVGIGRAAGLNTNGFGCQNVGIGYAALVPGSDSDP